MMNKLSFFGLSLLILLADQLSKWGIMEYLLKPAANAGKPLGFLNWIAVAQDRLPYTEINILPFFNIVMVWNQGVSFGMLHGFGPWLLVILSAAITVWFSIWLFLSTQKIQKIAIAMVIGGAIGNAIDRIRFGAVIDFLDFHAFGWHYPAFNIADSAIVLGVFTLIIYSFFFEKSFPG